MFVGRKEEQITLEKFSTEPKSGFLHVRGRRRIGKSWLLTEFSEKAGRFYFQGDSDSSTSQIQNSFVNCWEDFTGTKKLGNMKRNVINWDLIFGEITSYCSNHLRKNHVIVLDEIQWIAKKKSGFVSKLKKHWIAWEKLGNVKIIICGSSNRFFTDKVGGDSKILRGLRTQADLWVEPFTLKEVKKYYFPSWTDEEICLIYMLVGGVPYYLEQFPKIKNPINSINKAMFTKQSIFLDEFMEIISLEFIRASRENVYSILGALGQSGKTISKISQSTQKSDSTVSEIIHKLCDYGLVFEKKVDGAKIRGNRQGTKYYMRDFFLNTFFQLLDPISNKIKKNSSSQIFGSKYMQSKAGYYIPNFSGHGFELLIEMVLRKGAIGRHEEKIFKKLDLIDKEFEVAHYWSEKMTELDLLCKSSEDREVRVIEAKWVSRNITIGSRYIEEIEEKIYTPPRGYRVSNYLIASRSVSKKTADFAAEKSVGIIGLEDLF